MNWSERQSVPAFWVLGGGINEDVPSIMVSGDSTISS